ncbi:hypothetical protein ACLB2K_062923 [Fragaria x ananassa]
MEKRLRSSLQSSAEEFLSSATKLSLKSSKPSLKSLIHKIKLSSDLSSSLPTSLSLSISDAIHSFHTLLQPNRNPRTPRSPPTKRPRRSRRSSKTRPEPDPNPEEEKHQILACIAHLCAAHPAKAFSPEDFLPGVQALHDNLIVLESDSTLVSLIENLCEHWWKEEFPGRESLISQSLPFLLSRSLTLNKKADVHRVYALREAFTCFDFEDESIEDLKLLLIRCVISPLFLKTEEGRKFLAFLFGLSSQLLKEILAVIKSQIPFGRKSMLEAYGDVVFRGWKVAEEELRSEIENGFLQVLIEGAVHASSGSFAASIRRVLGGFINQRTTAGVEKLLFRLSEPVIFRSLQVANSNVRQNALHLLLDLFPLEDPDSTKEVKDSLLDKQFFLLGKLLVDDCPEFLNVLLPRLGHLMMDNVLSVRVAMADLLLLIRDIQNFQFHKVVKLDVLLSTLENDRPQVAQKITRLLMPSYFPLKETVQTACNRCSTLVKRSPMAGARFCEFAASQGASLKSLMELVRVMITLVLPPNNLDEQQVEGLLRSSSNLCNTLVSEPVFKKSLKEFLDGEKLKCLIAAAPTGPAQSCIASTVSPDDVAGLLDECMHLVTDCSGLSKNVEKQAEVRSAHNMFLSCDAIDAQWKNVGRKKVTSFEEDYSVAAGIAWQIRDLLVSVNSRKAVLGSQTLESLLICLKVISEVSILQCMQYECMDTFPVSAYTILALHMYLQNVSSNMNDRTDSSGSALQIELEQALDHVLNCTAKLCGVGDYGQSSRVHSESKHTSDESVSRREKRHREPQTHASIPSDSGNVYTEPKKLANKVKMLTAVQRFMVDAATIGFSPQTQERCLRSTSGYIRCVISTLEQQPREQIDFEEEDLKDVILCMKSSFTYVAKLLNLALNNATEASPLPVEASDLANDMLDLIISIELYLGSTYAGHLVAAVKPWVPDLILALVSGYIMKQIMGEETQTSTADHIRVHFPTWLLILAKTELSEASEVQPEDEGGSEIEEFPALKKILTMIVTLLKANVSMQGVFGAIFMIGAVVGLEKKNFGLVLGLLRFVCLKNCAGMMTKSGVI